MKTYIVAVSGGIDSVVLLHMLMRDTSSSLRTANSELVIAHVDHGIRADSAADREFVAQLAATYGYTYVSTRLHLGQGASEERAREARYGWLHETQTRYQADAIITAHHQDDVIETILINLIRGTGWRGLCSLREHDGLLRPLLSWSKADIVSYAIEHDLDWRDDSTNDDARYLRNYVRQLLIPRLSGPQRQQMIELYNRQVALVHIIDQELEAFCDAYTQDGVLSRYALAMVDDSVGRELISAWLGQRLPRDALERLRHFALTARPCKQMSIGPLTVISRPRGMIVSPSDI